MPAIDLFLDGDGCWRDLPQLISEGKVIELMGNDAPSIQFAALPGGMQSGRTSVTIRIELPDGKVLLTETSLALLAGAVDTIRARYGS